MSLKSARFSYKKQRKFFKTKTIKKNCLIYIVVIIKMSSPLGHTNYSWGGTDENIIPLGHTIYSWSALIQNYNRDM